MNISYNWLKELIDLDLSAEDAGKALTRVGLAVEGIESHGFDRIFDIDLTSNRPDCLSHLGVARELGVSCDKSLFSARTSTEAPMPPVLAHDIVKIEVPDLCHRFTARVIRNVKVGPSPEWLAERLVAIGERSINNIADITNYVMHELGQPMHAFDLDKLEGGQIIVRVAREGESITTLDEVERKLDVSMVAVCDAEKPAAIGGVMGGIHSGITDSTVNVLLEVAYFKRETIRATSRKLDLHSEASYRFERGVDIDNVIRASERAAELICLLAGGEKGEFIDIYPTRHEPPVILSNDISAAVKRLTGMNVETGTALNILDRLGIKCETAGDGSMSFIAPSWRYDINIEEDLVEEVARHMGYENIADELPPAFHAGEYLPAEDRKRRLRQRLADLGFDEAITYSFIDTANDGAYQPIEDLATVPDEPYVTLEDAVIEGAVRMRPTALPGLISAVRLNLNHQRRDLRLFEIGKVFAASQNEMPVEKEVLSLVSTGGEILEHKAIPQRDGDLYDLKGAVEAALSATGIDQPIFIADEIEHLRRGQSASIFVEGKKVGSIGRLNDQISSANKFRLPVYAAELDLGRILSIDVRPSAYKPLPRYPGVSRDITFIVSRDLQYEQIIRCVHALSEPLLQSVEYVDIFEGKGLVDGERALTIRLSYLSTERTLQEDEVESAHGRILGAIREELGISPRG